MSIVKYQALIKTIELGTLSKAAEHLGYSQSAISRMIMSLENEFGFPLLNRTKTGIEPTSNAHRLLPSLRRIVTSDEQLWEDINRINNTDLGVVRIGSIASLTVRWMPAAVQSFTQKHPQLELQWLEGYPPELLQWLREGKIDLTLMSDPQVSDITFIPLHDDPIMAVLPRDHPLAEAEAVDPAVLLQHPFIFPGTGSEEEVLLVCGKEKISPQVRCIARGYTPTMSMISKGLGVTMMAELLLNNVPEDVVVRNLSRYYYRTVGVCYRRDIPLPAVSERFIETMRSLIEDGDFA